jgi:hypothetical protein
MKTVLDNVTYSLRKAVVDSHPGETWNRTRGFRRREVRNALGLESLSLSLCNSTEDISAEHALQIRRCHCPVTYRRYLISSYKQCSQITGLTSKATDMSKRA